MTRKYLFFDTETTGLPKDRHAPLTESDQWPHLVQVAWVLYKGEQPISSESHLIYPGGYVIPEAATEVHGISTVQAAMEGTSVKLVLQRFKEALQKADYVIAHNLEFDANIIGAEMVRMGQQPFLGGQGHICLMKRSTQFCAIKRRWGYKWPKLEELHQKLFGEGIDGAHDALVDVKACARCFFKLGQAGIISEGLPLK